MEKRNKKSFVNNLILEHIKLNIKSYIVVLAIFVIGIILGMVFISNLSENQKSEISIYVTSVIESLNNKNEIDTSALLKKSVLDNIFLTITLWFVGSTIIGLPIVYGIIVFRGFCLGYTVSAIVAILGVSKGMIFIATTMLLQNLIFIPCILALAVSGTKLYQSITKDRRKENIKLEVLRHTIFSGIICVLLILSSMIEVYISTSLLGLVIDLIA